MTKLIQKIKSFFSKESTPNPSVKARKADSFKKKPLKKLSPIAIEENIQQLKESIAENGYYSTTVAALFKRFGLQKRHTSNIERVTEALQQQGLYLSPAITLSTGWKETVQLHSFPITGSKDFFDSELKMEDMFEQHKWHEKLNLTIEEGGRQFKPKGTRDRLDFKARDEKGNLVVLELKNVAGDKRVVEQVFRYRSLLKSNFPDEKVRCVIVTGSKCVHTARAIHGLSPKKQKKISWYVYNWDKLNEASISFEPVTLDSLNAHFSPSN